jgi:hypothetical protein
MRPPAKKFVGKTAAPKGLARRRGAGSHSGGGTFIIDTGEPGGEKEKLSITVDKTVVDEIRASFGEKRLSTSINHLLHEALAQERLRSLIEEMEAEMAPPSPESYERVFAQWYGDDA